MAAINPYSVCLSAKNVVTRSNKTLHDRVAMFISCQPKCRSFSSVTHNFSILHPLVGNKQPTTRNNRPNVPYFTSRRLAATATATTTKHKTQHPFTYREIDDAFASSMPTRRPSFTDPRSRNRTTYATYQIDASEGGWLQESTMVSKKSNKPPISSPYDWWQRASSRKNKPAPQPNRIPVYQKRVVPPTIDLECEGELSHSIRAYTEQFLQLMSLEEAEDEAVLKERLATWSLERLELEGYALTGMSAYWLQENQFGRPVATFSKGPGIVFPEHKLENGTQILISRFDPLAEIPKRGSVIASSTTHISVCFPEVFELSGSWRLDLGRPNLVYERMRSAISFMNHCPEAISKLNSPASPIQYILQGTALRESLLRSFRPSHDDPAAIDTNSPEPGAGKTVANCQDSSSVPSLGEFCSLGAFREDMRIQSWANRYSQRNPLVMEGDPVFERMNPSQVRAMATMVGQRLSLIQGPPGTGKTKTIIETVKLLKVHFEVPQPILLCTYTNAAVDNLVEGLVKAGVKPLRVGNANVKPSLMPTTLDYKLEQHPLHPKLSKAIATEAQTASKQARLSYDTEALESKLSSQSRPRKDTLARLARMKEALVAAENYHKKCKGKIYAIQQQMLRETLADADVICTTCITAACTALNVMDFPIVFLDEASMSTEPASLIPIMKGSQHISLIGDHKQLPPVIVSKEAEEGGLGVSLFERLTEEGLTPSVILDVQYRMHPAISRFPSQEFYNLRLSDGTVDAGGNILPSLDPPNSKHLQDCSTLTHRPSVVFLDHTGVEAFKGRSKVNVLEAQIVASVVEDLLLNNTELRGHDIGIIAPYAAQITLLTRMLNADPKYQRRFRSVLGDQRAMHLEHIEVKTVDGFEGREKEVIIFSTVRNNERGMIGFLADKRRLNVGLTRAKRGLFVVGSIATLRAGAKSSSGITKTYEQAKASPALSLSSSRNEPDSGPSGTVQHESRSGGADMTDLAMPTKCLEASRSGMTSDSASASSGPCTVIQPRTYGTAGVDGSQPPVVGLKDGLGHQTQLEMGMQAETETPMQIQQVNSAGSSDGNAKKLSLQIRRKGGSKGGDSWARYADYLLQAGLVVRLSGEKLESALYEHLDAARMDRRRPRTAKRAKRATAIASAAGATAK